MHKQNTIPEFTATEIRVSDRTGVGNILLLKRFQVCWCEGYLCSLTVMLNLIRCRYCSTLYEVLEKHTMTVNTVRCCVLCHIGAEETHMTGQFHKNTTDLEVLVHLEWVSRNTSVMWLRTRPQHLSGDTGLISHQRTWFIIVTYSSNRVLLILIQLVTVVKCVVM